MNQFSEVLLFLFFAFAGLSLAFSPVPPPGTPSFQIEPTPQILNLHIDCFVIENNLQVVLLASLKFPENTNGITLIPKWPADSMTLYLIEESADQPFAISPFSKTYIPLKNGEIILRLTYEADIYVAVSGPPGPWRYARLFAFYPPFLSAENTPIQADNQRIRFMMTDEIAPKSCADNLKKLTPIETITTWRYEGEFGNYPCLFGE